MVDNQSAQYNQWIYLSQESSVSPTTQAPPASSNAVPNNPPAAPAPVNNMNAKQAPPVAPQISRISPPFPPIKQIKPPSHNAVISKPQAQQQPQPQLNNKPKPTAAGLTNPFTKWLQNRKGQQPVSKGARQAATLRGKAGKSIGTPQKGGKGKHGRARMGPPTHLLPCLHGECCF